MAYISLEVIEAKLRNDRSFAKSAFSMQDWQCGREGRAVAALSERTKFKQ